MCERASLRTSGGGAERGETQRLKRAPGSRAIGTEPDVGLELTNREIMT